MTPPYSKLDPRTQLEQQIAADLKAAMKKRGASIQHHGTAAAHAPGTAPADITVDWKEDDESRRLHVEVAKRNDDTEFVPIVEHLNRATNREPSIDINVLYAGLSTSLRMARFLRNENQQREKDGRRGRLIFLPLNRLQDYLQYWATVPAVVYPMNGVSRSVTRWREFVTDLAASRVIQAEWFPDWTDKQREIDAAQQHELAVRQERLRKDIVALENKLRERGITGQRAHKLLIHLFFIALYEDKRGGESRLTVEGFARYRSSISPKDRNEDEYRGRSVHHLVANHLKWEPDIQTSGMLDQYESVILNDDFIMSAVLPIFERYPLSAGGIDFIGAVFEALARKAEKDNRIGQFFTPETAVIAAVRLVAPKPSDTVLDPACGTARFLIHAMDAMLTQAKPTPTQTRADVEEDIRKKRLLGADIDPWVATIAKMNMYLHGDGKSNIKPANGLALSASTVFTTDDSSRAQMAIDVTLTNPPLGDVNFYEVAADLARSGLLGELGAAPGTLEHAREVGEKARGWTNARLSVVPHTCVEEVQALRYEESVEEWRGKLRDAIREGNTGAERNAQRHFNAAEAKLAEVRRRIATGQVTYQPAGNNAKGGALFLSAILDYLKPIRDAGAPEEWKGGIVGLIVDEAVLNTAAYAHAREFIRRNYFVKAIVSLPRNAFEFLAKTTAKTSILVLTKKPDSDVVQRELVFYAVAQTIGYTSTGVDKRNDLPAISDAFDTWREAVTGAYAGGLLDPTLLDRALGMIPRLDGLVSICSLDQNNIGERLDFAYRKMKELIAAMPDPVPLGKFLEAVVRIPDDTLVDVEALVRTYAWVRSTDGRVCSKGEQDLKYAARDLRQIAEGDILVSGIDAVKGSIGVVGSDCDGLVVSKEFFVFRVLPEKAGTVHPQYVARLLRSPKMRAIIEGAITGVSNRTRIEGSAEMLKLPIPRPPPFEVQEAVAAQVEAAFQAQDATARVFVEIDSSLAASPTAH